MQFFVPSSFSGHIFRSAIAYTKAIALLDYRAFKKYMNKRFSGLLIAALLMATSVSFGQSRIAFLDATKILKRMPEAVDAETRLPAAMRPHTRLGHTAAPP